MTHSDSPEAKRLKQLTLRGFDRDLEESLRQLARERGISLNRAALTLMRRGAGLEKPEAEGSPRRGKIGNSLDKFFGVWTKEESREFLRSIEHFEEIDEEHWK